MCVFIDDCLESKYMVWGAWSFRKAYLFRFDYDFEREVAVKFNDYFEFPRDLDMEPYTGKIYRWFYISSFIYVSI